MSLTSCHSISLTREDKISSIVKKTCSFFVRRKFFTTDENLFFARESDTVSIIPDTGPELLYLTPKDHVTLTFTGEDHVTLTFTLRLKKISSVVRRQTNFTLR